MTRVHQHLLTNKPKGKAVLSTKRLCMRTLSNHGQAINASMEVYE